MARPTYRDETHWRRYQAFFPERLRIRDGEDPEETYWPWRGTELHLDRYAIPAPRCRAILLHGGGGHGRLLAPLAKLLSAAGAEVIAPDLPGYGLSRVPSHLFTYPSWIDAAADLAAEEHARAPLPLFFMGLSLGGMLAYQAAAATSAPVAGVVATTLCDPREALVKRAFVKGRVTEGLGLPLLQTFGGLVGGVRLPIRWFSKMEAVSNDPALTALICADKLGGGNLTPLRFLRSMLAMVPPVEPESFRRCPVLLAHPGADRWTPLDASLPFYDRLACPKELVVLEGCGHIPLEEPGASALEAAVHRFVDDALASAAG